MSGTRKQALKYFQFADGDTVSSIINTFFFATDVHSSSILLSMARNEALRTISVYNMTSIGGELFLVSSWGGFNVDYMSLPNTVAFQVSHFFHLYSYTDYTADADFIFPLC